MVSIYGSEIQEHGILAKNGLVHVQWNEVFLQVQTNE